MSFPSKEQRSLCWSARDRYWECLDTNQRSLDAQKLSKACEDFRKIYVKGCPSQWVKHFDRKRDYLKFKEKIEKHGYEPLEEK